jgi:hypothetical protein
VEEGEVPDDIRKKIPPDITLIYWDYGGTEKSKYGVMLRRHKKFGDDITFAGGAWTWSGLAPHNRYSIEAARASFSACREHGIKEVFLTMWGDNGGSCSPFSVLPALYTASEFAKGNPDGESIKDGFEKLTGMPFDTFLYVDLPNILSEDQRIGTQNPSKYLFYNDILLGKFDTTISEGAGGIYASHAQKLAAAEAYPEWRWLFKPLRLLCEILSQKADLGIRTRQAYKNGDKTALRKLIESDYKPLVKKIGEFYKAFATYWDTLFKPHGFDVMDIRLGGVLQRLKHAIMKIDGYGKGKTANIPELEEHLLDFFGNGEQIKKDILADRYYGNIATLNII